MKRCNHCGGYLVADGSYHEGQKEEHLKCLMCGREPMDEATEKKCSKCGVVKPIEEFYLVGGGKFRDNTCKPWRRVVPRNPVEKKPDPPKAVRPAVESVLSFFTPELRNALIEDCRKQAVKEVIALLQASFA